jgi:hypothetical protein
MKIRGLIFVLLCGLLLGGCGNSGNGQPPGNEQQLVTFSTVQKGEGGSLANNQAQVSVIRNNTDWAIFWNQLNRKYSPEPNIPSINFSESVMIALVDAPRVTGGYSITITSIQITPTGITVNANQVSPGGCMVTQALTQPFHLVTVPVFSGGANLALSQSVLTCGQ